MLYLTVAYPLRHALEIGVQEVSHAVCVLQALDVDR
jgi:hypothetical protein